MVHTTGERQGGPRLEHQRSIYSATLKANTPIFEIGRHFIERAGASWRRKPAYGV
jgi:hypothetical protein